MNKKKKNEGWDVARWYSACLACARPWVQSQHQKKREKNKKQGRKDKNIPNNPSQNKDKNKVNIFLVVVEEGGYLSFLEQFFFL
jgi:hypothetical protein